MSAEAIAAALEAIEAGGAGGLEAPLPKRFCFVEGTYVATLRGEMTVQSLRVGDQIRAKKGSFHVISDVSIHAFEDLEPEAQARISVNQIMRGAVEEGLPRRDLYVTEGQQFELSRRLEVSHAVRMTVRKSGAALRGYRFVVFTCEGLPMIRAEGIWTTLTPVERAFPVALPEPQPGDSAPAQDGTADPAEAPAARPVSRLMEAAARTDRPIRRRLTRILSRPLSEPERRRTETGTPGP